MPIRILHVVDSLGNGGLENGLVNLIQHMDPKVFDNVVCTIRGLGPNAERLPRDRVRVLPLDASGWRTRLQTPSLIGTIRNVQPDIVHSRNWAGIEAVFAARVCRTAAVHSEHGYEAGLAARPPGRRVAMRRVAFELADRVLAVSRQLRDTHARQTGFRADRIGVIHNGVDCARFSPNVDARQRVRAELDIRDDEMCIGCVANLLPVKDHLTLLKSLATQTGDWRLLLVGEGSERARLQEFVDAHAALRSRVHFVGRSTRVPDLLRAMDVFVLPSIAEGICNSLLEAMATCVAVVASAVGGNPEVVVDGESGLLFEARDVAGLAAHLTRLRADAALRASLSVRARDRVRQKFSIASMVNAYEQLYRGVRPQTAAAVLSQVSLGR